jgi:hypothetical protein
MENRMKSRVVYDYVPILNSAGDMAGIAGCDDEINHATGGND